MYSNPRISFDGKNWFLSVGYDKKFEMFELTGASLGIDVGIEKLAVCSDGEFKKNINKTKRVKHLEKKLRKEQRKLSRKLEDNIKSYDINRKPIYEKPLKDMKNIQKQNQMIRNLHKKRRTLRNRRHHGRRQNMVCSHRKRKRRTLHLVVQTRQSMAQRASDRLPQNRRLLLGEKHPKPKLDALHGL